jgi:RND family efflux transporter MFP subunit
MLREGELRESERRQAEPGIRAIARAREDLALALTTPGRVAAVLAKPGARVRAGDALLALEASEAKAEVELLRVRAASRLEEQASKAEWDLAKLEEERWNTVHERGASTDMQLRKAELETKRSKLAYELFVQQREEAALQLEQAEARLRAFTLVAPVDGLVDEVVVEVGEVIEPGKPVVRLVNPSVLRIDVAVPTQQTLALSVGGKAIMTSLLTTPATVATGTITHIANVADASSATRLVRVEVPTPEGLPAGIECFVRFGE